MCYTTLVQPKSLPTKLFNATLIQPDFFKLLENNLRFTPAQPGIFEISFYTTLA